MLRRERRRLRQCASDLPLSSAESTADAGGVGSARGEPGADGPDGPDDPDGAPDADSTGGAHSAQGKHGPDDADSTGGAGSTGGTALTHSVSGTHGPGPTAGGPCTPQTPGGTPLDSPALVDIATTVLDRLGVRVDPAWGLPGRVLPRPATAPSSPLSPPTSERS